MRNTSAVLALLLLWILPYDLVRAEEDYTVTENGNAFEYTNPVENTVGNCAAENDSYADASNNTVATKDEDSSTPSDTLHPDIVEYTNSYSETPPGIVKTKQEVTTRITLGPEFHEPSTTLVQRSTVSEQRNENQIYANSVIDKWNSAFPDNQETKITGVIIDPDDTLRFGYNTAQPHTTIIGNFTFPSVADADTQRSWANQVKSKWENAFTGADTVNIYKVTQNDDGRLDLWYKAAMPDGATQNADFRLPLPHPAGDSVRITEDTLAVHRPGANNADDWAIVLESKMKKETIAGAPAEHAKDEREQRLGFMGKESDPVWLDPQSGDEDRVAAEHYSQQLPDWLKTMIKK